MAINACARHLNSQPCNLLCAACGHTCYSHILGQCGDCQCNAFRDAPMSYEEPNTPWVVCNSCGSADRILLNREEASTRTNSWLYACGDCRSQYRVSTMGGSSGQVLRSEIPTTPRRRELTREDILEDDNRLRTPPPPPRRIIRCQSKGCRNEATFADIRTGRNLCEVHMVIYAKGTGIDVTVGTGKHGPGVVGPTARKIDLPDE